MHDRQMRLHRSLHKRKKSNRSLEQQTSRKVSVDEMNAGAVLNVLNMCNVIRQNANATLLNCQTQERREQITVSPKCVKRIFIVVIVAIIAIIGVCSMEYIGAGEVGVVYSTKDGIQEVLQHGIYFINPFYKVAKFSVS